MTVRNSHLLLLIFLFCINLISAPVNDDQKKVLIDEQLRLADGLLSRGHYPLAIEEYQRIIKKFPDEPLAADAWSQLAEAYSLSGKLDAAMETFRTFFSKFPDSKTIDAVRINYATALSKTERPEERNESVKILLSLKNSNECPELVNDAAAFRLARIYIDAGDIKNATAEFTALAAKKITSPSQIYRGFAVIELSSLLNRQQKNDEAIKLLVNLCENKNIPQDAYNSAMQYLASFQCEKKDFLKAAETYEQLRVLFPGTPAGREASYRRLECLFFAKEYATLIKEIDRLSAQDMENLDIRRDKLLYLKAYALQEQGFLSGAEKTYNEITEASETSSDYFAKSAYQTVRCLFTEKKTEIACKTAESFVLNPKMDQNGKINLCSLISSSIKAPDKIVDFAKFAVSTAKNDMEKNYLLLKLASLQFDLHLFGDALKSFGEIKPDTKYFSGVSLSGQAKCLENLKREKDALIIYNRIIKELQDTEFYPDAMLRSAVIMLYENRDSSEAAARLEKLKSVFKDKPEIYGNSLFYLSYLALTKQNFKEAETGFSEIANGSSFSPSLKSNAELYLVWALILDGKVKDASILFAGFAQSPERLEAAPVDLLILMSKAFYDDKNMRYSSICCNALLTRNDVIGKTEALIRLSLISGSEGKADMVMEYLRQAEKLRAKDERLLCELYSRLGEALLKQNGNNEAVLYFEKCTDNTANKEASARAKIGLARILSASDENLARANRYAMSVFILSEAPELCEEAMILSVELSIRQKKYSEADATLGELRQRFPESMKKESVKKLVELIQK